MRRSRKITLAVMGGGIVAVGASSGVRHHDADPACQAPAAASRPADCGASSGSGSSAGGGGGGAASGRSGVAAESARGGFGAAGGAHGGE